MRKALLVLIPMAIVVTIVTLFLTSALRPHVADERSEVVIRMTQDLRFVPDYVEIEPGQTVVWINESEKMHSISTHQRAAMDEDDVRLPEGSEAWDSSLIAPGDTFRRTLKAPGLYRYYCNEHQGQAMVGEILVRSPDETAPAESDEEAEERGPP